MVKDVFFLATAGKRSRDNYVDGMYLIEMIAENNYAWAIKNWWNEVDENPEKVEDIFHKMVWQTIRNVKGVNYNDTYRSRSVMSAFMKF